MSDQALEALKGLDPAEAELSNYEAPSVEVLERIFEQPAVKPSRARRPRRPWTLRPATVALAAVVVAGVIALVVAFAPSSTVSPGSPAGSALEGVARIASAQAADAPAGAYLYDRLIRAERATSGPPPYTYLTLSRIEQWVAPDGSGRVTTTDDGIQWPGPRDERNWKASGAPEIRADQGQTTSHDYEPGQLDGVGGEAGLPPISELPPDPDRLLSIFAEAQAASSTEVPLNVKSFEYASSLLLQTGSDPELRAALYRALGQLEGVEVKTNVTDPKGRTGTGVSIDFNYAGSPERYTLIFDPATSQPLAELEELRKPALYIDGSLLGYQVLEQSGAVATVGDRP